MSMIERTKCAGMCHLRRAREKCKTNPFPRFRPQVPARPEVVARTRARLAPPARRMFQNVPSAAPQGDDPPPRELPIHTHVQTPAGYHYGIHSKETDYAATASLDDARGGGGGGGVA